MYHAKNLSELVGLYTSAATSQQQSQFECCLIKYCLPVLGFKVPEGRRTKKTTAIAYEFLSTFPVGAARGLEKALEWSFGTNQEITSDTRRQNRKSLKEFLRWCEEEGHLLVPSQDKAAKRMPKSIKKRGVVTSIKVTDRAAIPRLSFSMSEAPPKLVKQMKELHSYYLEDFRPDRPSKKSSVHALKFVDTAIAIYFSWLIDEKDRRIETLSLEDIFPKKPSWSLSDINNPEVTKELEVFFAQYFNWAKSERNHSDSTIDRYLSGILKVARYQYRYLTNTETFKYCEDINICNTLRRYGLQLREGRKTVGNRRKDEIVEPSYEDLLEITKRLKQLAAPYTANRTKRNESTIAYCYQKYLWLAILVYIPPRRSRVLRELETDRTFRKINDVWTVTLWAKGSYKTYDLYGDATIPLPDFLSNDFDLWMEVHRPQLNPNHNFIFTSKKGTPLQPKDFSNRFAKAVRSASDNKFYCSPHDVRAIVVTHLRNQGATDVEMESLALAMGHSVQMQKQVYDRRNASQKLLPAQELINKLSGAS